MTTAKAGRLLKPFITRPEMTGPMIYLHGSGARRHQITDPLSKLTRAHQKGRLVLPGVGLAVALYWTGSG